MSIENLKTYDPFAEADEDTGETKQTQNYIHIRIQQRNGRKTLTTVQGLPKKFDQKKILKVIKKKFGRCKLFAAKFPRSVMLIWFTSLQWHHRRRHRDGRGDPTPGGSAQGRAGISHR
jgi:hypothetical protein